jgi:protein O-GlcNAc transferase
MGSLKILALNMKVGRNDPCPCGSGKKYKNCCQGKLELDAPATTQIEINQLVYLFQTGRYPEMEMRARSLAERYPNSGIVWNLFGTSLAVQGKDALSALKKAAELLPGDPDVYNNLGNAQREAGEHSAAVQSYRHALQLKPRFAEANNNLGNALKDLGQDDAAMASYQRALKIKPDYPEAHYNLGNALKDLGELEPAMASYQRALKIKPDYPEAHFKLAKVQTGLGQLDAAAESYRQGLRFSPEDAAAHSNLGVVLADLGQLPESVASCLIALRIEPDYAEAHFNLANTLGLLGQLGAAIESYHKTLELKPDFAHAHNNLGNALLRLGQVDAALESYRKAVEVKPDYLEAFSNVLLTSNYSPSVDGYYCLQEALRYGDIAASRAESPISSWLCAEKQPKRLRVGLVSGDLGEHPVGYFLEGLLANLDPNKIEVYAYETYRRKCATNEKLRGYVSQWRETPSIRFGDEELAQLIRQDAINVLIDLAGHTGHNRLPVFAWRPAPVQVTWLGYLGTTGLKTMDYILADHWSLPPDEDDQFVERPWRMPESYICFSQPGVPLELTSLPALENGFVTFGCFNALNKVNDRVIACWARMLQAVPESRLFFKTMTLGPHEVREALVNRFAVHGIEAERLQMEGAFTNREEHFRAYQRVDIALDPFPYPGITTTVEALWMGVPSLALKGDRFLSHQGETILRNVGLPEWIAQNEDEYVEKAASFAADLGQLSVLRADLRQRAVRSPLFDAARFARNFEETLWRMWEEKSK